MLGLASAAIVAAPLLAICGDEVLPQEQAFQFSLRSSDRGAPEVGRGIGLLAAAETSPQASKSDGAGALDKLRALTQRDSGEEEFLPVDKAFKVEVKVKDAQTLVAELAPQDTYYLYRDKIGFTVQSPPGAAITGVSLPRGEMKSDPNFGDTEVFHRPVQAVITLDRSRLQQAGPITVEARYQGCSEKGLCYPPTKKTFDLTLAAWQPPARTNPSQPAVDLRANSDSAPTLQAPVESGQQTKASAAPAYESETSQIARILRSGNFWLIIGSFFAFGLVLSFTPCVFPMIPILSGIIVGQGHRVTRRHAFSLSALYVLGMAITYALAGIAAGLSGTLLSTALQNAWVLGAFALVFVALALSMFGFYELQLPSALQTRLASASNQVKGGTLWGVFVMGVLSALIVGPCVAGPLAGALIYIGQTRDVALGGSALFVMAIGMGVPLLAVGLSAGTLLPRAGSWMESVKHFFGVVLLGLAIWIISPIIPTAVHMLLWAALLVISAIYLHAIDPLPNNASGFRKLWKGVGVIALLLGVALLVGALSGGRDILQPLSGMRMAQSGPLTTHVPFQRVGSLADLEQKIAQAGGKPVMLDFYADWCVACKEMERETFVDPQVQARMGQMVLLQADVTANNEEHQRLLKRFGLYGPPGILFFGSNGRELEHIRVIGFQPPAKFQTALDAVLRSG